MSKNRALAVFISLLSAGWVIPLWLAVDTYLDYWQSVGLPLSLGMRPVSSFPYLEFAANSFGIAMLWLGIVVASWAYAGRMCLNRRDAA